MQAQRTIPISEQQRVAQDDVKKRVGATSLMKPRSCREILERFAHRLCRPCEIVPIADGIRPHGIALGQWSVVDDRAVQALRA